MNKLIEAGNVFVTTGPIYVREDGKTVCEESHPQVAFMKYGKGATLKKAQAEELVFPQAALSEPLPDSDSRQAQVADAETRRGRKKL